MNLSGKIALVTGGARMGEAVAVALARQGCRIILTWRKSRDAAERIVQAVKSVGGQAASLRCDLSRPAGLAQLARTIEKRFKKLHVVVNLASIYEKTPAGLADAVTSWDAHMNANARSAYLLSQALAPLVQRSGAGRFIHISDWLSASRRPRYKEYSAYYASKTAVVGVIEAMALELAPTILVNAIAPGPMLPPPSMTRAEIRQVEKATPLGRWGGADEMAKTVLFLATTDFITGETIRLDGGRHLN